AALMLGGLWLRRESRSFRERWDALMEGAKADSIKRETATSLPVVKTQAAVS
ncbi:MAG: hypothetical protein V7632_5148, partial [Bradyrhizobium sp.]